MSVLFQQTVGWLGTLLLLLILSRAVHGRFLTKYPNFNLYIGHVGLSSAWALLIAYRRPDLYGRYYWAFQLVSLLLGLGVTWECFRHVLPEFSGVRRFAKTVLVTMCVVVIVRLATGAIPPSLSNMVKLERDLRSIQVLMLIWFVFLVVYYGMPLGRNVLGIALGYGIFVGTNLLSLAFRSDLGPQFFLIWSYLQPLEYLLCELIWCIFLWSYWPSFRSKATDNQDYEAAAGRLDKSLTRVRSYVWDVIFR